VIDFKNVTILYVSEQYEMGKNRINIMFNSEAFLLR